MMDRGVAVMVMVTKVVLMLVVVGVLIGGATQKHLARFEDVLGYDVVALGLFRTRIGEETKGTLSVWHEFKCGSVEDKWEGAQAAFVLAVLVAMGGMVLTLSGLCGFEPWQRKAGIVCLDIFFSCCIASMLSVYYTVFYSDFCGSFKVLNTPTSHLSEFSDICSKGYATDLTISAFALSLLSAFFTVFIPYTRAYKPAATECTPIIE